MTPKVLRSEALGLACALALVGSVGVASTALRAQADSPRIPLAEFKKLVDSGGVIVLDVRSLDQFRAGHVPGATSVPLDTVAARASEWKKATKPIVTYCS